MFNMYALFSERRPLRKGVAVKLPISINSDEEYSIAIDRLQELEFKLGYTTDDVELVAITEAMLRWEMRKSVDGDLHGYSEQ